MNKIMLPPCKAIYPPKCGDACGRFGICEDYEPEGDFDALAAAILKADLDYDVTTEYDNEAKKLIHKAHVYCDGGMGYPGGGPTPTAALLNAINEFNEEAEGDG